MSIQVPIETVIAPARERRWRDRLLASALGLAIFVFFLWLYTRTNTFPLIYHPDEEGKAAQILGDYRNYRHPQLMLECATLLVRSRSIEDEQEVVVAGRCVSAAFASGAVLALALAACLDAGLLGMLIAGAFVGFCPFLLVHAHFMKEDTALVLGIAMFVLGLRLVWRPWKHRIIEIATVLFLGLACAVATSGKYVGAFSMLPALLVLFAGRRWRLSDLILRPFVLLVTFGLFVYLFNWRAFHDSEKFQNVFQREATHPITGHFGYTMPVPHMHFLEVIGTVTPLPVLLLSLIALVALVLTWRKRNGWDVVLPLLILLQIGMLCFCRVFFTRYALPAVVLIHLFAALGLIWTWQWINDRFVSARSTRIAFACVPFLLTAFLAWLSVDALFQFRDDSRDRVRTWLTVHTTSGDRILAETYAGLFPPLSGGGEVELKDGVTAIGAFHAGRRGNVDSLRQQGYTHVVVCRLAYDRFLNRRIVPEEGNEDEFDSARAAYRDLFDHAELAWSSKPKRDWMSYANPEIRVYRLK
jgi:hypothetical protein